MKLKILSLVLIFAYSEVSLSNTESTAELCKVEVKKVEKLLGAEGTKAKLTAENYKKAIEALQKSFRYPSAAELKQYSKSLQKKSKRAPKEMEKVEDRCLPLRVELIKSLQSFAKSQKGHEEVRTEIWDGLSKYFQIKKYPKLAPLLVQAQLFSDTVKVYKPQDKGLDRELKMQIAEIKTAAKDLEKRTKELEWEDKKAYTPEHYHILRDEDEKAQSVQEVFIDIVKSTRL